jgi:hypothetical protein
VDGTGFENNKGSAVQLGYRGGKLCDVRGANAVANVTPATGQAYLISCSGGVVLLDNCTMVDEGAGSGSALLNNSGATIKTAQYV